MKAATWPRENPLLERLLVIDSQAAFPIDAAHSIGELSALLAPGDLVVVNDAATLPASLHVAKSRLELRLVSGAESDGSWRAILFGAGDWRTPTENRPAPNPVAIGDRLELAPGFHGMVTAVSPDSARLVTIRFNLEGAALLRALYAHGEMVQYSYLRGALESWTNQTAFSARPWAVEMPSAGRPLSAGLLVALRRRGVEIAALTHAAGLSSTGEAALDRLLPLPERYDLPPRTVDAIKAARTRGSRVIAAGTSVVRALEGNAVAHGGRLVAGSEVTNLVIGPGFRPRVVDGLLTGMHEAAESHYQLLQAFAPAAALEAGWRQAEAAGFLMHEFGDSCLII